MHLNTISKAISDYHPNYSRPKLTSLLCIYAPRTKAGPTVISSSIKTQGRASLLQQCRALEQDAQIGCEFSSSPSQPAWMLSCGTYCRECALGGVWTRWSPDIHSNHYDSVALWSACSWWQLRQSRGTLGTGTVCGLSALGGPCWGNHIWAGQGWSCPVSLAMRPLLCQAILMPAYWGLLSEPPNAMPAPLNYFKQKPQF